MRAGGDQGAASRPGSQPPAARWEIALLVLILLAGVGLRMIYLAELRDMPELTHPPVDEAFTLYWARGLATDDWSLPPEALGRDPDIRNTAYLRPPAYPFILAGIYSLSGGEPLRMRAFGMIFGLLNLFLAWKLGRRLLGPEVALFWPLLMLLAWPLLYFEGGLNASVFLVTLILLLCIFLHRLLIRAKWIDAVAAAVLVGLMALLRANTLLLAPFLLVWAFRVLRRRHPGKKLVPLALLSLAAGTLTLAPAMIRNALVEGAFVPVSANGGLTLYHGNNDDATGISTNRVGELGLLNSPWDIPDIIRRIEIEEGRKLSFSECSKILRRRALRWIFHHPWREVQLLARRFVLFWGPDPIAHNHLPAADREASALLSRMPVSFPTALGGAVSGVCVLFFWWRRKDGPREWRMPGSMECVTGMAVILAAWCLSFLPFFVTSLYRVPLMPILLLGLAVALVGIRHAFVRRKGEALLWLFGLLLCIGAAHISLIPVDPGRERRLYNHGVALALDGKNEEAVHCFYRAIALDQTDAAAHDALGKLLFDAGDLDGAEKEFSLALHYNPRNPLAHANKALVAAMRGQCLRAARAYEEALAAAPGHADWWRTLGVCREQLGLPEAAAKAYEEAVALGEEDGQAANNLAWILATSSQEDMRDGGRALQMARKVVQKSRTPGTLDTLAAALAENGRFDEAVRTLDAALELGRALPPGKRRAFRQRRQLYLGKHPYRDPPPVQSQKMSARAHNES